MNVPRYAAQVARLLSTRIGGAVSVRGEPERGTATIERAIVARRRSRGVRLALLAVAVFALFVGGAVWIGRFSKPSVAATDAHTIDATVTPHGAGATLSPGGSPLHGGDRLAVGTGLEVRERGTASVELSTGTRLDLEGNSTISARTLASHQRFYLSRGALEARVAKLGTGERFVVETPDAEVEVRGTEFRLEVAQHADQCEVDVQTRLLVHEGVVEVRARGHVVRVRAGERWPECHESRDQAPSSAAPTGEVFVERPAAPVVPGASAARRAEPTDVQPAPSPANQAALVEQNDLFAEGVAARKRGDTSGAISAYGRLIQKYPSSALVENATVERLRLLAKTSPEAARREAQRYLERYPAGFARAEAERVLTGGP